MHEFGTILLLLAEYPLWSESFLQRELQALRDQDGRFRLAALREAPGMPGHASSKEPHPGPAVDFLAATPARLSALPRPSFSAPRSLRLLLSRIRQRSRLNSLLDYCTSKGVRHIHAEFCDVPALLARTAAGRLGIPFSVGAHARDVFCCKYPLKQLLHGANFVTVCNSAARDVLSRAGAVPAKRLHTIHHGVPLQQWPMTARGPRGKNLRIFWAGRMVPKKGLDLLFRALAKAQGSPAKQQGLGWRLRLAGDGPEAPRLKQLADRLGIAQTITWLPPRPHDKIRAEFADADALILPARLASDGDRDGIPNIALEAMASGLPVICTPTGGLSDIATPHTAWLAESATAQALIHAVHSFLDSNTDDVNRRRQQARSRVETDFDLASTTARRQLLFTQSVNEMI